MPPTHRIRTFCISTLNFSMNSRCGSTHLLSSKCLGCPLSKTKGLTFHNLNLFHLKFSLFSGNSSPLARANAWFFFGRLVFLLIPQSCPSSNPIVIAFKTYSVNAVLF
jgi:hypothetical protein